MNNIKYGMNASVTNNYFFDHQSPISPWDTSLPTNTSDHTEIESKGVKHSKDKLPIYTVVFKQFPNAIKEVVKCSRAGHEKYKETDGDWKNYERVENAEWEYLNAAARHMTLEGINEDMLQYGETLHEAQVIWNLLAALEIKLKNNGTSNDGHL